MAIKVTDIRLDKSTGSKNFFGKTKVLFCINKMGISRKSPIRHLENSNTNKDEPRSKAVLAAVGTTAKHSDDIITINIPNLSCLSLINF